MILLTVGFLVLVVLSFVLQGVVECSNDRHGCGRDSVLGNDFVNCLLAEPSCRECDIFFAFDNLATAACGGGEIMADICSLYEECCPECNVQYQELFSNCVSFPNCQEQEQQQDDFSSVCPDAYPIPPPPIEPSPSSPGIYFTDAPGRPTPMPNTRSPSTTYCDELKAEYSYCRIQQFVECALCDKLRTFTELSTCDEAKDEYCTNNEECCYYCNRDYLDWINQCMLPEYFGVDCQCDGWSPPTEATIPPPQPPSGFKPTPPGPSGWSPPSEATIPPQQPPTTLEPTPSGQPGNEPSSSVNRSWPNHTGRASWLVTAAATFAWMLFA